MILGLKSSMEESFSWLNSLKVASSISRMKGFDCLLLLFFPCDSKSFIIVQDAGVEIDPLGDLNTESERKLGQLVLEK